MKPLRKILIGVLAFVLALCVGGSFWTRSAMEHLPFLRSGTGQGRSDGVVNQRPWLTAQALAPLAVTKEEQGFAREAERLADHEVDQAFQTALRQASAQALTLTGEAAEIEKKVEALQQTVREDQVEVDRLTAAVKGPTGASLEDELEVSKSELDLDKGELEDETEHLARASGDKRSMIQRELTARQAAMKKYDDQAAGGEVAVISTQRHGTLWGRWKAWLSQRTRAVLIQQARSEALADAGRLSSEMAGMRNATAAPLVDPETGMTTPQPVGQTMDQKKARVARLRKRVAVENLASLVEDRMETEQQLAKVYADWGAQVTLQHQIMIHLLLNSLAQVALIGLGTMLAAALGRMLLQRSKMEPRQKRTLETIVNLAVQLCGLLLIALVTFGAPNQVPTILGLATAGLTVVFQDFILAFFGWFVLMGRNGIRVGDWVEINGVGGEVVEIGLFRTRMLETGNWTDKGHPTGRRVTFTNSFAISGTYFNFSTAGQWMWDELTLNVPQAEKSYEVIEEIHKVVRAETEKDAQLAEEEWRRVAKTSGLSQFNAEPSVDLRPAASGVDLKVRYVTRANDRFATRNRIYQGSLDVLQKAAGKS